MKILSLQGGGCLGYGQALLLAELEKRAGKPCHELFDVVAGTSVGSIIGACIASGVPASAIVAFFTKDAPEIFKSSLIGDVEALDGPKYPAAALESALQNVLQFATLSDCKSRLIVPAYDYATDRIIRFDSGVQSSSDDNQIVFGNDSSVQLWQIARSSSAAQTYFPAYEMVGMVILDGGNTSDNAPDMLALTEVLAPGIWDIHELKMLSLGSGNSKWEVNPKEMVSPSPLRAGLATIKINFAAGEDSQVSKARKLLGFGYYRLQPDLGDGIAIDDAAGCLAKIPPAVDAMIAANKATLNEFCSA